MSAIQKAREILDEGMHSLQASSCTFYVRDPRWADEFLLLLMPGVMIPEPMHGFMLPLETRVRISDGSGMDFFPNAARDPALCEKLGPPLKRLAEGNRIFHDFTLREKVASCARLLHRKSDIVTATLFINFATRRRRSKKLDFEMTQLMSRLVDQLEGIRAELTSDFATEAPGLLAQLTRILRPIEQLATLRATVNDGVESLNRSFESILDDVLEAFAIDHQDGFGSIHILNPESGDLRVRATRGHVDHIPDPIHPGEGVVSWVALKKKAILIQDMRHSHFRSIHKAGREDVVSELAVPMVAGGELIGVFNVESVEEGKFNSNHVRTLWCAANQAAVALHLSQQASAHQDFADRIETLLDFYHEATTGKSVAADQLGELANIINNWTKADRCQLWRFDPEPGTFTFVGSSYKMTGATKGPRSKGWSAYALRKMMPVWIRVGQERSDFDAQIWNEQDEMWVSPRREESPPTSVNPRASQLGPHGQLGFPIPLLDQGIGVAWLKYSRSSGAPPTSFMRSVLGLIANAGIVMDFVQRYEETARSAAEALRDQIKRYTNTLFPEQELVTPRLQLYVKSVPLSAPIGGDFYTFINLTNDGNRVGVLLGDGEGHGIPAALKMLPVFTTFRLYCKQTGSTKFVLERMNAVANDLNLPQTSAIYFIIDLSGETPAIYASSAAHPPLLIISSKGPDRGESTHFPPIESRFDHTFLGPLSQLPPLGENSKELKPGSIIIAYTDGVTEARDEKDSVSFGNEGILQTAMRLLQESPKTIAENIFSAVKKHSGGHLADDATVLVIKLN